MLVRSPLSNEKNPAVRHNGIGNQLKAQQLPNHTLNECFSSQLQYLNNYSVQYTSKQYSEQNECKQ